MIDRPYVERIELLRNLGARRAQIHEQKISPLIDEFEAEITEHSVLQDLKITKLFLKFIEHFNEFVDVSEETYQHLVQIIEEMNKINADEYVTMEQYNDIAEQLENLKVGNMYEEANLPRTSETFKLQNVQQAAYANKVKSVIAEAEAQGKNPAKMKMAIKAKLNAFSAWQAKIVDMVIDDYRTSKKYGKTGMKASIRDIARIEKERSNLNKISEEEQAVQNESEEGEEGDNSEEEADGEEEPEN
jgi:hypothetical protein